MASDILIVDDEADIRDLISGILEDNGYETRTAYDSASALSQIALRLPNLVFLDIWMRGSRLDGLQLLDVLSKDHPDLPVVIISGHGNVETAVSAIKRGAYDYIEKPFKIDRLLLLTQRALEARQLKQEVAELKVLTSRNDEDLVGSSQAMSSAASLIEKSGPTNSRIMIFGPSGSGKELIAKKLHENSHRHERPFVKVQLGFYNEDVVSKVLFGSEKNIDGVKRIEPGALEKAHGGTLYLSDIADLPPDAQKSLLRVLVQGEFHRVGGGTGVQVDVRVLSASNTDMTQYVETKKFRSDLFHRLNVVPLVLPPIKERREDIPQLAELFIHQICTQYAVAPCTISTSAMAVIQGQDWPGNVRQLRNAIERLIILCKDNFNGSRVITADMLPGDLGEVLPNVAGEKGNEHLMTMPLRDAREIFERQYLVAQIERFGGNVSRTAEFVGMERSALHRKIKSLGI